MNNLRNAMLCGMLAAVYRAPADGDNPEASAPALAGQTPKPLVVDTNPLAEDVHVQVEQKLVTMEDAKFSFRTQEFKDKEGNAVKWKRDTFQIKVPLLTTAGVIAALQQGDKTTELVRDAANDVILNRARGIINEKVDLPEGTDPRTVTLEPDALDISQLTLAAIASLPKSERGAGIPKESWQAFVKDYVVQMQTPEAIALFSDKKPRSPDVLEKHAILLQGKFNQVRSRQDVIKQMLGFIDIWVQVSPNAEEHLACYEHLKQKGNALLQGETFEDL